MNRHAFQQAAKQFRAGRLSLEAFTNQVFGGGAVGSIQDESSSQATPVDPHARLDLNLPIRADTAHKGDVGRVLVIGGSDTMPGAIGLTAMAVLRTGSGLVIAVTPRDVQLTVASFSPCLMTVGTSCQRGMFSDEALTEILERCKWADVAAIGPGMGRSIAGQKIVRRLYEDLPQPLVVDADGLNNLVDAAVDLSQHRGPRILTPHPGEFQRMTGVKVTDREVLEARATELAQQSGTTIVLKGHGTLVTDGPQSHRNQTGNSGMATAGSGDVLTGMIASLIGQGMQPFNAAQAACHLHGLAGDIAAGAFGRASLIATDLIDSIASAFQSVA
jgi:NAD(P)H-hydrate epimerase